MVVWCMVYMRNNHEYEVKVKICEMYYYGKNGNIKCFEYMLVLIYIMHIYVTNVYIYKDQN